MNAHLINRITAWLVFLPWLIYAVWELVVLALRTKYPEIRTISMEARSIAARGLASIAYAMAGMTCHWFITWRRLPLSGWLATTGAILWWAGLAAYLLSDALTPEARVWIRHPAVAAVIGGVGAWLLFGQREVWPL